MIRRLLHRLLCSCCRDGYVCPVGRSIGIEIANRPLEIRRPGTLDRN